MLAPIVPYPGELKVWSCRISLPNEGKRGICNRHGTPLFDSPVLSLSARTSLLKTTKHWSDDMEISTAPDVASFIRPCFTALGIKPSAAYIEQLPKLIDADRAHVAYIDGRIVGGAGAYSHTLAVPGGTVSAAAIFGVGVLPSHRRRGILTKLQEVQLSDVRRRGEALAYLWSSEAAIYGRFGYGMSSLAMQVSIDAKGVRLRDAPRLQKDVRLLDRDDAYRNIAPIYADLWSRHPGMFLRSEEWWRKRLGNQELSYAVWEDGYAIYLVRMDASHGSFSGEVEVLEALANSVDAYRRIWQYLLSLDLVKTVRASYLPVDHPLLLMLTDLRKANCHVRDGLWVRIVDVEAALTRRALHGDSVVIRVLDHILPENDDIWRVGANGVSRVTAPPDLVIDIADLGAVYLGGFTFSDLNRSGRVHEPSCGALRRADDIFGWHRKPWCPEPF